CAVAALLANKKAAAAIRAIRVIVEVAFFIFSFFVKVFVGCWVVLIFCLDFLRTGDFVFHTGFVLSLHALFNGGF
ncbi:MAG: hypothetical protein ACKPAD_13735, partial [Bacteroidota bacterium]